LLGKENLGTRIYDGDPKVSDWSRLSGFQAKENLGRHTHGVRYHGAVPQILSRKIWEVPQSFSKIDIHPVFRLSWSSAGLRQSKQLSD